MTRKLILMVMSLAATAAVALGDVLRWDGSTDKVKNASGHAVWANAANWVSDTTSTGAVPKDGDDLILTKLTGSWMDANVSVNFAPHLISFDGTGANMYCGHDKPIRFANGTAGIVSTVSGAVAFGIDMYFAGNVVPFAIASGSFNTRTGLLNGSGGRLVKSGAGDLILVEDAGNDKISNLDFTIKGGSVLVSRPHASSAFDGHELLFDGNGATFSVGVADYLHGQYVQEFANFGLSETAAVTDHDNRLNSDIDGFKFLFTGEPKYNPTEFSGAITGKLSLDWAPDSNCELVLSGGKSTTVGSLKVSSGKVTLADGARFTSLASLEVADGAALEVGAGSVIVASSLVVNGAQMPSGYYKNADWFAGDGIVFVPFPDPGTPVAATWVGGVDAKLSTDGNWQGGKAPNLTDGTAVVTVKPTAALSILKVPSGCYLNGLKFDLPSGNGTLSVSLETAGGRLLLGAAGLDASAAKASVDFTLPIVAVTADSVLDYGPDGVFDFKDEFAAMGGTIAVKGRGHADLRKDAELGGAVLDLQSGSAYFVLHGVSVDAGLNVNTPDTDAGSLILAESGTTNYLKGCLSIVGYKAFTCNAKSAGGGGLLVLEGGCDGNANTGLYNVRVDKKPLKLVGRLYSPLTDDGDVYLNVASNQFGRNSYTMGDGVNIHALVPYAIWGGPRTIYSTSYLQTQVEVTGNKAASMDLGGFDQEITAIRVADSSTYDVTSEQPAQLHLDFQWPSTMYQSGTTTVYPDVYANNVTFSGNAGLTFEGKDEAPWNTFALKRDSLTQGKLEVKSGTMAMEAKWPNASVVEVSGGKLVLKQARAFGKSCVANLTGGQVELAASQAFASLTVDGVTLEDGIYGGKDSPAAFKPKYADGTYVFTGKGVARIGDLGMAFIVR